MGGLGPGLSELIVAGKANDIVGFAEGATGWGSFLKAIQAQEFGVDAGIGITDMRVVAAGALHLVRL